ncbi:4-hydroxythreonine-4-phosphate dehydrogenase [Candidatus Termititenax persephonae]|uniref:4-hydroxythreonine-4-phosphate dehydrogenase n=1 Tax=Candidatus Termititenax persephonae TaxID=2218525 RepID=A0A388TG78_9BACT|nr:4-hydroxythreonine-4-phosphate dehydrogenase [Candidatus Termititenax persephonae]
MRIGITMGDPNGVGAEIIVKLLKNKGYRDCVVYGNPLALSGLKNQIIDPFGRLTEHGRGRVTAENGRAAYQYLQAAAGDALSGAIDAVVTAPLNKQALRAAGYKQDGHTEILAELTGTKKYGMFFYAPELCVMLTTIHQSIRQVPRLLTRQKLADTIDLGLAAIRLLGLRQPRVAVCGLNPHAGENGIFGREETTIITPVIKNYQKRGVKIAGPFPADALFTPAQRRKYDLVIAQYHDQGLIPLKLLAFERAVNVTVGLPIIRTSVDHGTAYDIAGQGKASTGSLAAAIRLARQMVKNRG